MSDLEQSVLRGAEVRELRADVERIRQKVMDLIAAEILCWDDAAPPRYALSALWGKVRDLGLEERFGPEDRPDWSQIQRS